ncbi:MAG: tRNA-dihydrouridine synthase family protein, partial [Eggerthellaceae bacterium]|nr:tRNA-dihydrouridine synthase family protein [Eggerthellaceae bacterium]
MSKDSLSECRVLLGPMAGVSDAAFRKLCRECGADIACTEMVSAKGMSYSNVKTGRLLELYPGEDRVIAQIFGHEPNVMADAAKRIEQDLGEHLECIDINMGCPARKITSKGDGAALMKDINLASSIVEAVAASVVQPVSVKFRRGWSPDTENAVGFAQAMERAGADRLCIHGRYAVQIYAGKADWDIIRRIKEAVSVPVIGNGDVASAQ